MVNTLIRGVIDAAMVNGQLGVAPVDWQNAALRLGEELASVGPDRYYEFTPEQWLAWALESLAKMRSSHRQDTAR